MEVKHPESFSGMSFETAVSLVKEALSEPEVVLRGKVDPSVYLYYRRFHGYFTCVVAKHLNAEGLVYTYNIQDGPSRRRRGRMGTKVKVFYDSEMDTLDIWFDEPPEEGFSRELDEGIIVKYDRDERVVGLEILFLSKQKLLGKAIPAELRGELGRTLNEFVDSLKAIA